jgi:hypothetical protein
MRVATRIIAPLALSGVLAACGIRAPTGASLPAEFPADFPTPPSAKLITAAGPLPFMPAELRGITAQWTSTLSKDELTAFYARTHGAWAPYRSSVQGPSAGPITLGTILLLTHEDDGMTATVAVGMTNTIDSGTLVQVTILPRRPLPSPSP